MRPKSTASHLRPYRMLASRRTTINYMFAAAVAPHDHHDEQRVGEVMALLGNDPSGDLACAYCGAAEETWDHVFRDREGQPVQRARAPARQAVALLQAVQVA